MMLKDSHERASAAEIWEYFEVNFGDSAKNLPFIKEQKKQERF